MHGHPGRMAGLALVAALALGAFARAEGKKVLMFTKSQGYEHSVVQRGPNGKLGLAEQTMIDLGKQHGFVVTVTKDGTKITADNLKHYAAVLFFTQGNLAEPDPLKHRDREPPMRAQDRQAILDYVRAGGGFVGTHCGGADTFHEWTEAGKPVFLEMVGGEFIGHGAQQKARVDVVDPSFPAVKGWPASFELNDEWYSYRFFHTNIHVLMMLQTEGMQGNHYDRQPYPITWCSTYGKGRLFYTGMGHREDVWTNPLYQRMVTTAVRWALGEVDGDASPNLKTLLGDPAKALIRINPPKR